MSFYDKHVFFCVNQRAADAPRPCCAHSGAENMLRYAKEKAKTLNTNANIRIQKAGCLDRCELGPLLVIYPEGVWYTYVDQEDIDEILSCHLERGEIVERLQVLDHA